MGKTWPANQFSNLIKIKMILPHTLTLMYNVHENTLVQTEKENTARDRICKVKYTLYRHKYGCRCIERDSRSVLQLKVSIKKAYDQCIGLWE